MTNALRDRARAFEEKFAYEQTYSFRAETRRNKLAGLWAASRLGVSDAEAYAQQVVLSCLQSKANSDVTTKLRHEFDAAGIAIDNDELQTKMHDLLCEALRDLEQG